MYSWLPTCIIRELKSVALFTRHVSFFIVHWNHTSLYYFFFCVHSFFFSKILSNPSLSLAEGGGNWHHDFLCVCFAFRHISLRDDAFDLSRD
jgi:hypothetical protein